MGVRGTWNSLFVALMTVVAVLMVARAKAAAGSLQELNGIWLAERADTRTGSNLSYAWESVFIVKNGAFRITHFYGSSHELTGTLTPSAQSAGAIDLNVQAIDLSEVWTGMKYPQCTLRAIYKIDGNRLTVCFRTDSREGRPAEFATEDNDTRLLTLVRAGADFKGLPKEVVVTVRDESGNAVRGATLFSFMNYWHGPNARATPNWRYGQLGDPAGPDGVIKVKYDDLSSCPLAARDSPHEMTGITAASPATLQTGTATVVLHRERRIRGTIRSSELTAAGKEIGWTNTYLLCEGQRIGGCDSWTGNFEFIAPAGNYTLNAYGEQLKGRYINVTVPAEPGDFEVPPIELTASRLTVLRGGPAPELDGVLGWKGTPTKLADLKGKYVLLDFWGYWCGPCVREMPVLMALYDHFKDRGLAVIGVHVDGDDNIDTAAKLDQKLSEIREKFWNGRDLPFAVALTSGKMIDLPNGERERGGAAAEYGILGYPTTVLVDPEGRVVGRFYVGDEKQTIAEVEKLLNAVK